ncbi:MAG: hypothetical protein AB2L22_13630 [Syntrophales bacterium]
MNSDIRIATTLFNNIKIRKLIKLLGSDGVVALLKIWIYFAVHRPSGEFSPCSPEDLELVAEWSGSPGAFVSALLEIGLIEEIPGGYRIHDWQDNNPWAFGAEARSEKARKAACARWNTFNAPSMPDACSEHANRNAPSPSPSPIPKPNSLSEPDYSFGLFYSAYPRHEGRKPAEKAWTKVLKKGNGTIQAIMTALEQQKTHKECLRSSGQFCPEWPLPASWLNGERWTDEIPEARPEKGNGSGWGKVFG